jgi:hypothetical protein
MRREFKVVALTLRRCLITCVQRATPDPSLERPIK